MFLLRAIVASLAVFFLMYAALSALLVLAWKKLEGRHLIHGAASLYALRSAPLLGAFGLVVLFMLPAFLYLEPRFIDEKIGTGAIALAAAGAIVVFAGVLRFAAVWRKNSQQVSALLSRSRRLEFAGGVRAYEVRDANSVMFVTGVRQPKLLVSSGAVALLDAEEMQAAIRHERAHVTRGDNLKKLLLQFCALPGLGSLERQWMKATEEAADDFAARDAVTALHLASALIKMTRASARISAPELATALAPTNGASVSSRVERLLAERRPASANQKTFWWITFAVGVVVVGLNYAWALRQMHEITELLVR